MTRLLCSAVVCVVLAIDVVPAEAHPQHRTTAQVDVNHDRKVLEVGLRVHPDDLARAIEPRDKRAMAAAAAAAQVRLYLQERFVLQQGKRKSRLKWVGQERDGAELWLYFEMPFAVGPARLSNRVFFELFDKQINVVRIRDGGEKRTVSLTAKSDSIELVFRDKPTEQSE